MVDEAEREQEIIRIPRPKIRTNDGMERNRATNQDADCFFDDDAVDDTLEDDQTAVVSFHEVGPKDCILGKDFDKLSPDNIADVFVKWAFTSADGHQTVIFELATKYFLVFNGVFWKECDPEHTAIKKRFIGKNGFVT